MEAARQQWFTDVLEAGLTHEFYRPADVLAVAPPALLATHLPRNVLGKVLEAAMKKRLSAEVVISTATARVIATSVPNEVLWKCIAGAAETAKLTNGAADAQREPQARKFLQAALDSALKNAVLTPEDILRHVDAQALVDALPHQLTAKLLSTSLATGVIDAGRVIEVVGVAALAQHVPTRLLWSCVQEANGGTAAKQPAIPKPKRSPTNGAAAKAAPAPKPEKPEPEDFHEQETDVRDPSGRKLVPEVDMADVSDIEILEEELPTQEALQDDSKKSSKRSGLFGRRKR